MCMDRQPGDPEVRDLGLMIKKIDIAFERQMNRHLQRSGLTRAQAFMLKNIERRGGRATLKELEGDSGVAQSTSWGVARRLEEKGMIAFEADPHDARVRVARLTPAGAAECEAGTRERQAVEAHFSDVFSPAERAEFMGYLERMFEAIDTWQAPDADAREDGGGNAGQPRA